jgi:hypothetical protein
MIFKHFSIDGHICEEAHGKIYRKTSHQTQIRLDKQTLNVYEINLKNKYKYKKNYLLDFFNRKKS